MTLPRGRHQGNVNPRDPRYRTDQPWPAGTRVLVVAGSETDNIDWLRNRYGTHELIAEVLDVGQQTFLGYCPVAMTAPRMQPGVMAEEFQWPVDGLIPEDEWGDLDRLEEWLDA